MRLCRYRIKKDLSSMFGIDASSGALSVLNRLDDLTTPVEFTLTVEASDSGEQPLKSEAEVSVRIESGNACIFEKPSYTAKVAEDAIIDKVFKQLHARCPNGKPVFSIVSGDNFSQFECNVNSGKLNFLIGCPISCGTKKVMHCEMYSTHLHVWIFTDILIIHI